MEHAIKPSLFMVVPVFNEARRFSPEYWEALINGSKNVQWIFVNDGSTDETISILEDLCRFSNVVVLHNSKNLGKGEAIRQGFLYALPKTQFIGQTDFDACFNPCELIYFCDTAVKMFENASPTHTRLAIGSRVKLSGSNIQRSNMRHIFGRTIISIFGLIWKDIPYDPQSGLKVLHLARDVDCLLSKPARTRWFFDIETMLRLDLVSNSNESIQEIPIKTWMDLKGSHIKLSVFPIILMEILLILAFLRKAVMRDPLKKS